MVVELLALGRCGSEERATRSDQVGAGKVEVAVDQEVFLFGTRVGNNRRNLFVAESLEDTLGLDVERLARSEKRRLLVERFARPRNKCRWDTERGAVGVFEDVGGARHIPSRVATGFERGANAAVRKARRVGLTLNERLPCELDDCAAIAVRGKEAVMLLCRRTRERVEDMSVMGRTLFNRPVLHRVRDDVGDRGVQT